MDEDMEEVEIVFAQRLASGEPVIRKRALKLLQEHIKEGSAKNSFTSNSLGRLCKGIHYAMWMQDKMVLQEELADEICALLALFKNEEQMLDFMRSLIQSLSKEWPSIDRWRMDKFLMLIRRLVRTLFSRLAEQQWESSLSEKYLQMFRETLISAHSPLCASLKYQCASLWLDELDNAGGTGMDKEKCLEFLQPYIQLIKENISDSFFRTICTEIFDTILHDYSERLAEDEEHKEAEECSDKPEEAEKEEAKARLEFDYARIGELLFEAGKQQQVPAKRRKRIYALCKKFESAQKGTDPYQDLLTTEEEPRKRFRRNKRSKK